jgi:mannosyl-oligosaccharide alpha-1,3-glucosidase
MVKHENFKTCDQSGFCKRNRAYADTASGFLSSWRSPYELDAGSIKLSDGQLTGTVLKTLVNTGEKVRLPLTISFLESGLARVTLDEEKRQKGDITLRHDSKARKERYNEAQNWVIVGGLSLNKLAAVKESEEGTTTVLYGPASSYEAVIRHAPFGIDFKRDGITQVKFNERGFMNLEHWRQKIEPPPPVESTEGEEKKEGEAESKGDETTEQDVSSTDKKGEEDESTWWDEAFGGSTDSKPRGPESIAMDISFPNYGHVYGIASHAGPLSLKETR